MAKKEKPKLKVRAANKPSTKYDDWMHSQLKKSKKDALGYLKTSLQENAGSPEVFMLSSKRVMTAQKLKLDDLIKIKS